VIFLSTEEAVYAGGSCPDLRSTVMPPLFDYDARRGPRKEADTVLEIGYVGNFGWWPNQLGLRWFTTEVLPHVTSPMRVNLFGRSGGWQGDPRVVEQGIVESIDEIYAKCDLLICPSLAAGGVCVKLAEAVYNGMPVLAHTHAGRGLGLSGDPALRFLDKPGEWIELLNSPGAADLSKRNVSAEVAKRFAVESHKDALQKFVESAILSAGS
jgi:glycosyltransferase involved in cell wall biosynthesis